MKKLIKNSAGFAVAEVVLVITVLLLIGLVALRVRSVKTAAPAPTSAEPGSQAIKTVNSDADLQAADQQLNQENLDAPTQDETKLDAELSTF